MAKTNAFSELQPQPNNVGTVGGDDQADEAGHEGDRRGP